MNKPKPTPHPRKQHVRWYCKKRGMCALPLVWMKWDSKQPKAPVQRSMILVATRDFRGMILTVPDGYHETVEYLNKHEVRWWTYPPEIPFLHGREKRVLTCDDFAHNCQWTCPTSHVEARLELAMQTLEKISGLKGLAKRLASSSIEFITALENEQRRISQ